MASKPLIVTSGLVAFSGLGLIGYAPKLAPLRPIVAPQVLEAKLDEALREAATVTHERASGLAGLVAVQNVVATNAVTAQDQQKTAPMFRPEPGDTVTLGQVPNEGAASVLLVVPEGDAPTPAIERSGTRLEVDDTRLFIAEVLPVTTNDARLKSVLRGAVAVRRPVELSSFVDRLDALGAIVRIEGNGKTLKLGERTLDPEEAFVPLTLAETFAAGDQATAVIPMTSSGPPLRPIGGGLVGVGVVLLGLGLRGRRPPEVTAEELAITQPQPPKPRPTASMTAVGVGTVLDATYEITSLLGQGGMGTVWQARHLRLPDKRVAIKVLSTESTNPELLARFHREAEVTSKLGHPNIVGVLDFNQLPGGSPYIVLEYLYGESLAQRLERGPIPLDETLEWARQIGSALGAAHRAGIVHRDLKPDNIFVVPTESGKPIVKVLDFGISKMRGSVGLQTQDSTVLGTPQYMSPEQANGKNSEVDARADVWALGAIVYEMLTGMRAFWGESMTALLVNVLMNPAPSLRAHPGVPEHVAIAIERALEKEPADRWPDVSSFITALTGTTSRS